MVVERGMIGRIIGELLGKEPRKIRKMKKNGEAFTGDASWERIGEVGEGERCKSGKGRKCFTVRGITLSRDMISAAPSTNVLAVD